MTVQNFSPRPGVTLAYSKTDGAADMPGLIFLGGFRSDMTGTKAMYLEQACAARGQSFVRFDYTGHGASSGRFEDGCIGDWLQDALDVFDHITSGPQIVAGSSMGGWIALLLARQRAARVAGLIGIAPAPDFTEDFLKDEMTAQQAAMLAQDGVIHLPNSYGPPYVMTQKLFDDGKNHLLLTGDIDIRCPVRLIHGKQDAEVPWMKSGDIARCLASRDVKITWVEDGDHRLSRDQDLVLIDGAVRELSALAA